MGNVRQGTTDNLFETSCSFTKTNFEIFLKLRYAKCQNVSLRKVHCLAPPSTHPGSHVPTPAPVSHVDDVISSCKGSTADLTLKFTECLSVRLCSFFSPCCCCDFMAPCWPRPHDTPTGNSRPKTS